MARASGIKKHEELLSKALFYTQNGIGVLAGGMQIEVGIAITGASWGIAVVPGVLLIGHGANNIAEGVANIYNGPDAPSAQGPIRRGYQALFRDSYKGNMAYYSTDLFCPAMACLGPCASLVLRSYSGIILLVMNGYISKLEL